MTRPCCPYRSLTAITFAFTAGLVGCGGGEQITSVFGEFDGPSRVDFGEVAVGDVPVARVVEFGNKGNFALTLDAARFEAEDGSGEAAGFSISTLDGQQALPMRIEPGVAISVHLRFHPQGGERYAATLILEGDLASTVRIDVVGVGRDDVVCGPCVDDPTPTCDGDTLVRVRSTETCPGRSLCVEQETRTACAEGCNADLSACNECGNGRIDPGETCDASALGDASCTSVAGLADGNLVCNANCGGYDISGCKECGNGQLEADELCDGARFADGASCTTRGFQGGQLACDRCVAVLTTGCFTCGDGSIDGPEVCDGTNTGTTSCDVATAGARPQGALLCDASCLAFDTGGCSACGDGRREATEVCDGAALDGQTCQSLGSGQQGSLACLADCSGFDASGCRTCGDGVVQAPEACDGTNLGGRTCSNYGRTGGQLTCSGGCVVDSSGCYTCGDGALEGPELCDGANLGGATCSSIGAGTSGTLRCNPGGGCLGFDTSDCYSCGNGIIEGSEQCEPTLPITQICPGQGTVVCNPSTCQIDMSRCTTCGDGVIEGAEVCDGGNLGGRTCTSEAGRTSGVLTCNASCTGFDASACYTCSDGRIEGPEVCDGSNLGGQTCGSSAGLTDGVLRCNTSCLGFDAADCHTCGNGTIEGPEICDGAGFGSRTCGSETGRASGALSCQSNCRGIGTSGCYECGDGQINGPEVCDGANLRGASCATGSPAHASGAVTCVANCQALDRSGCYTCGNGQVEGPEQCDGSNLNGLSCSGTTTFANGNLGCDSNCLGVDGSACHTCGNGAVEGPEVCDGSNLDSETCASQTSPSRPQGSLACESDCYGFDTTACFACGDGVQNGAEQCDGADLGGRTCADFGRPGGNLICEPTCVVNLALCSLCGDGVCEPGLGEDRFNCPAECDWTDLALGNAFGCGLRADGSGWCWGGNTRGQLGLGAGGACPTGTACAIAVAPSLDWATLHAGRETSCGLDPAGVLRCWGDNRSYLLGTGLNTPNSNALPLTPSGSPTLAEVKLGYRHGVGRTSGGLVYTWGLNNNYALGRATGGFGPVVLSGLTDVVTVAAGTDSSCVRHSSGAVSCWGHNRYGQVGPAGTPATSQIVGVPGISGTTELVAGGAHYCALQASGQVLCWGYGQQGQLGRGSTANNPLPLPVTGLTDAVEIASASNTTCARRANGSVWCWGHSFAGALGRATTTDALTPLPVPGLANVTNLYSAPSGYDFCARRNTGEILCWGYTYGLPSLFPHQ